jgi:hypothetical protein
MSTLTIIGLIICALPISFVIPAAEYDIKHQSESGRMAVFLVWALGMALMFWGLE